MYICIYVYMYVYVYMYLRTYVYLKICMYVIAYVLDAAHVFEESCIPTDENNKAKTRQLEGLIKAACAQAQLRTRWTVSSTNSSRNQPIA